jgi:hypothetical protein
MATIGTITFHQSINYGAVLQAYALQKVLTEMGHASEIIDYCPPRRGTKALSQFSRIRHFVWQRIVRKMITGEEREKKTEEFRRKYLQLSSTTYTSAEKLHSSPPLYDAYITGSDQVWNPKNNDSDSSYFLAFAPPGKTRISYAPSFGITQIPDGLANQYREWLNQMHRISSREVEGRQIIAQLTGRDAEIVLDPTLLLDEEQWKKIAAQYENARPYILSYYMPGDKAVNESITRISRHLSAHTGWGIVCIGQREYMRLHPFKRSVFDAGPTEFLGLIQNASFVVTNSFHGTAFSINYRKPFLVPINQRLPPEKALSSRITSLLKTLKLENLLLPIGQETPIESLLDMDYRLVEPILQIEKQRSIEFLKSALGEV